MVDYTPLSSDAWEKISVDAVSAERLPDHRFYGIRYKVNYPNGYGVSIIKKYDLLRGVIMVCGRLLS